MSASITALQWFLNLNITENTGGGPAGIPVFSTFDSLNQSLNLSSTTNPYPQKFSIYQQALITTLTPNFTSAQGTNGNINATGLRLLGIVVVNPAASTADVTIATGAANGYSLPQTITVKPGGFVIEWFGTALSLVDSTHKTVDITGDATTTPEIGFIFG